MILNIFGSVAILLASVSTEPRDVTDSWVRILSVTVILAAIWL